MTHSTDVATLARWMAGDFSNQEQAFENPPFFAHVRVCVRPLPADLLSGRGLYVEQAYDILLNQPYRSRVLNLAPGDDCIIIENYAIDDPEEFYGGARDPQKLKTLTRDRLQLLSGCSYIVRWTGNSFKGEVEPGRKCCIERKGKTTYLASEFEIDENRFISFDRGFDPNTNEQVWGSLAGPFEFVRWASFAEDPA
mgnify:CR=1 FL=1